MDPVRLRTRLAAAKSTRRDVEDRLDDCYRYALPGRLRFTSPTAGGAEDDIFDETAVVALEDFASIMASRMTPANQQWVTLTAAPIVAQQDQSAVNADLALICAAMFDYIHASNFGSEAHELYLDLGCSTGVMVIEERDGVLLHNALPLTQAYLDAGMDDSVGGLFRERKVRAEMLPALYPAGSPSGDIGRIISTEPDKPLTVTDAILRAYDGNAKGERSVMVGGGQGDEMFLEEMLPGVADIPFVACRMSKASGEVWGRGPVMRAMAGIKTTNLTIELLLQNAAMALIGMYAYEEDGTTNIDNFKVEPGAVIPHAPGSSGLRRIDVSGREFNVANILLDDQRRNIRRALYSEALSEAGRTPASALEVSYRTQDLAERVAASFGRLTHEFIQPYIRRVLRLLEKMGVIQLPIPMEAILIRPNGPLARSMGRADLNNMVQAHQILAGIYGPEIAAQLLDQKALQDTLQKSLGLDRRLFAPRAQAVQGMAQAAQAAAAQQGVPTEGLI